MIGDAGPGGCVPALGRGEPMGPAAVFIASPPKHRKAVFAVPNHGAVRDLVPRAAARAIDRAGRGATAQSMLGVPPDLVIVGPRRPVGMDADRTVVSRVGGEHASTARPEDRGRVMRAGAMGEGPGNQSGDTRGGSPGGVPGSMETNRPRSAVQPGPVPRAVGPGEGEGTVEPPAILRRPGAWPC